MYKEYDDWTTPLQAMYIQGQDPFPEVETFINDTVERLFNFSVFSFYILFNKSIYAKLFGTIENLKLFSLDSSFLFKPA